MRMPAYEELSKEQDEVCILAPLNQPILVTGPPGTGKTVIAFYRAETIAKAGGALRVLMYNKVLNRFTSDASSNPDVNKNILTWDSWFSKWWFATFGERVPTVTSWVYDWDEMLRKIAEAAPAKRYRVPWGHVVIDEGQDFPAKFYLLAKILQAGCADLAEAPVMISVFADENQRLFLNKSSTISEIKGGLCVPRERCYKLTRNWRNTREIANFASHFYCGLATGKPDVPEDRRGELPTIHRTDDLNGAMEQIVRYAQLNDDIDIAVFTPSKSSQTSVFNKLTHRLQGHKHLRVQQYTSEKESLWSDPSKLVFGQGGLITVLCKQSCKGLEFDAVFIPELERYRCDPGAEDQFKMDFYVMCSRARTHLCLFYTASRGARPEILSRLPSVSDNLAEWKHA